MAAVTRRSVPSAHDGLISQSGKNPTPLLIIETHCHAERSEASHRTFDEMRRGHVEILPCGQNDSILRCQPMRINVRRNRVVNASTILGAGTGAVRHLHLWIL